MTQVCIIPLPNLPKATRDTAWAGAREAARIWMDCLALFQQAMATRSKWPTQYSLQTATKGKYALHSQTIQMVSKCVLTAFSNTKELRKSHPEMRMKYPHRPKYHYALHWPAQAVQVEGNHVILPMGQGRAALKLPLDRELTFAIGACKLVWKDGWELHVTSRTTVPNIPPVSPGPERATGDLGEIHLITVVTTTNKALLVSGRGIRSIKRHRCMGLSQIAQKRSRCKRGSRREKRLAQARRKLSGRTRRQILDLRHKGPRSAINFCIAEGVSQLFVGNPDGVRRRKSGPIHNGRIARWEYGKDLNLLEHKCGLGGIQFSSGSERGTSSHCPVCKNRQRPTGRNFTCQRCKTSLHRDIIGGVNMHPLAFGQRVLIPKGITYLRPGHGPKAHGHSTGNKYPVPGSSSRPDTGQTLTGLLSCGAGEPGNRLTKTAIIVGTGIHAPAPVGSTPTGQGALQRARPQTCSESQEARPLKGTRVSRSTGRCFDIGNTTATALEEFEDTKNPQSGLDSERSISNGCMMRLSPVVIAYRNDRQQAVKCAMESATITHRHPVCLASCAALASILQKGIIGKTKEELLDPNVLADLQGCDLSQAADLLEVLHGSYKHKQPPEIEGAAYAPRALEAALWAFHTTDSFEKAVLAAANLGNDADTTAAICGQIAGAHYGLSGIPKAWQKELHQFDAIKELAQELAILVPKDQTKLDTTCEQVRAAPSTAIR